MNENAAGRPARLEPVRSLENLHAGEDCQERKQGLSGQRNSTAVTKRSSFQRDKDVLGVRLEVGLKVELAVVCEI